MSALTKEFLKLSYQNKTLQPVFISCKLSSLYMYKTKRPRRPP